jgi:hypothetical protein
VFCISAEPSANHDCRFPSIETATNFPDNMIVVTFCRHIAIHLRQHWSSLTSYEVPIILAATLNPASNSGTLHWQPPYTGCHSLLERADAEEAGMP